MSCAEELPEKLDKLAIDNNNKHLSKSFDQNSSIVQNPFFKNGKHINTFPKSTNIVKKTSSSCRTHTPSESNKCTKLLEILPPSKCLPKNFYKKKVFSKSKFQKVIMREPLLRSFRTKTRMTNTYVNEYHSDSLVNLKITGSSNCRNHLKYKANEDVVAGNCRTKGPSLNVCLSTTLQTMSKPETHLKYFAEDYSSCDNKIGTTCTPCSEASFTHRNIASCSQQASSGSVPNDDITIDELASYFDTFVYIPKKMSSMAEMMYI